MAKPADQPRKSQHTKDLIMLFAIPLGIALIAALVVYLPSLFAKPSYDFIYSTCSSYSCVDSYSVNGQNEIVHTPDNTEYAHLNAKTELRYYDVETDSSRVISLSEAKRYRLNTESRSPDGYLLERDGSGSGFLFWSEYDDNWYLKDGVKKKKANLSSNDQYYNYSVKLLGWVSK